MADIAMIGLDIAKDVFQVHGIDKDGNDVVRQKLKRSDVIRYFEKLPPCTVGIEACSTSHHWGRSLVSLGHTVRLIPVAHVKPFVHSQKNDAIDAKAICEAIRRPHARYVPVKPADQQAVMTLHKMRDLLIRQRTSLINAFRSHLAEYGHVSRTGTLGVEALKKIINGKQGMAIPRVVRDCLNALVRQIGSLHERGEELKRLILIWHRSHRASKRLAKVPGIGALSASAMVAAIEDVSRFKSGRHMSAWLGLVPRQHSSGGKILLGRITKRGNSYLRKLLVVGAKNVLVSYKHGKAALPRTIAALVERKPLMVAAVALANKLVRIAWVLLSKNQEYRWPHDVVGRLSVRQRKLSGIGDM